MYVSISPFLVGHKKMLDELMTIRSSTVSLQCLVKASQFSASPRALMFDTASEWDSKYYTISWARERVSEWVSEWASEWVSERMIKRCERKSELERKWLHILASIAVSSNPLWHDPRKSWKLVLRDPKFSREKIRFRLVRNYYYRFITLS